MQVLFSGYCPLLDTGLTLGMRLLYTSVTWCYITNTLAVPCSVLVPFIALVFGVYPLVLNRDFALAATLYYTSSTLVTMVRAVGRDTVSCCEDALPSKVETTNVSLKLMWQRGAAALNRS